MSLERQVKHLEFIQGAIDRQAGNSFAIKGWSITLASALYAYTITHMEWWLAVVAILPGIGFAFLDVYYLRLERMFRELFTDVADEDPAVDRFSMNIGPYRDGKAYPYCRRREVWKSPSVYLLYGGIVLVGVVLLGVTLVQDDGAKSLAQCVSDAF